MSVFEQGVNGRLGKLRLLHIAVENTSNLLHVK